MQPKITTKFSIYDQLLFVKITRQGELGMREPDRFFFFFFNPFLLIFCLETLSARWVTQNIHMRNGEKKNCNIRFEYKYMRWILEWITCLENSYYFLILLKFYCKVLILQIIITIRKLKRKKKYEFLILVLILKIEAKRLQRVGEE